jgi:hypothetical protein
LDDANRHTSSNHTVNGECASANSVPAVTDVFFPHDAHLIRRSASGHPPIPPHPAHTNPSGQRNHVK